MSVDLASLIVDVPDFPRPGITYYDITPLLASPAGLAATVDRLAAAATVAGVLVLAELADLAPRDRLAAHGLSAVTALLTIGAR